MSFPVLSLHFVHLFLFVLLVFGHFVAFCHVSLFILDQPNQKRPDVLYIIINTSLLNTKNKIEWIAWLNCRCHQFLNGEKLESDDPCDMSPSGKWIQWFIMVVLMALIDIIMANEWKWEWNERERERERERRLKLAGVGADVWLVHAERPILFGRIVQDAARVTWRRERVLLQRIQRNENHERIRRRQRSLRHPRSNAVSIIVQFLLIRWHLIVSSQT